MQPDDKEATRSRLAGLLKKVPASVANGSVQDVRSFKKLHATASKVCAAARSSQQQLQSVLNQIEPIYRSAA